MHVRGEHGIMSLQAQGAVQTGPCACFRDPIGHEDWRIYDMRAPGFLRLLRSL